MPPPQGTDNFLEGPGDYTVTKDVHNDTYAAIKPSQFNLKGKAVLISGGSRGVGRETALSFARAGASMIAIAARSDLSETEHAIKSVSKAQVLPLKMDVTDATSVAEGISKIEESFGRLDVVVNVAGILGKIAPIADTDPEEWWNTWNVNLRGPYLIVRASLPLVLKSELKTFVSVASVGAHLVNPAASAYQTGKLALVRFTQFIAAGYGDQGVIAMSIHPGNILNDIVSGISEERKPIFTETNALPADTTVWLTAVRREWLNGRYVNCTWDMPQLEAKKDAIVKGDKLKVKLDVDF